MKKVLIISMVIYLIPSCSNGLFSELNRLSADPETTEPRVLSFGEESVITIQWDKDVLSDEYILYRALDGNVLNFEEVYRGVNCKYRDVDGIVEELYHYSLSKVRGLKVFERSDSAFGVFSMTREDFFENNNSRERATTLEQGTLISSNLYAYRDSFNTKIMDEDWYRISVPAGRTAYVVVRQIMPLASDGINTDFRSYLEGQPSAPVKDESEINIINGFTNSHDYYLKIYPEESKYFTGPGSGGNIVSYQIFIKRVE